MPRGLIDDEVGMGARCHCLGDFVEMSVHGVDVAPGKNKSCSFAQGRADRAENPDRTGALIGRHAWAGAAPCPASRQPDLLADPCLVTSPELNDLARVPCPDCGHDGRKVFLKMSCVSGAWA